MSCVQPMYFITNRSFKSSCKNAGKFKPPKTKNAYTLKPPQSNVRSCKWNDRCSQIKQNKWMYSINTSPAATRFPLLNSAILSPAAAERITKYWERGMSAGRNIPKFIEYTRNTFNLSSRSSTGRFSCVPFQGFIIGFVIFSRHVSWLKHILYNAIAPLYTVVIHIALNLMGTPNYFLKKSTPLNWWRF